MPKYVDGYVLPVRRKDLKTYRRLALRAGKLWRDHGALEFRECMGEDLNVEIGISFPKRFKLKADEIAVFSWIVFKSRAHRDKVNAKVMDDPRMAALLDPKAMPFDSKRMTYGGFEILVDV